MLEVRSRRVHLRAGLTVIVAAAAFVVVVVCLGDFFTPASPSLPAQQAAPLLTPSGPALRLGPGVTCYDLPDGILCTCDHATLPGPRHSP